MARTILFLAILSATAVHAHADEPVKIPLKDIWAYKMPGTQDVRELQKDVDDASLPPAEREKKLGASHFARIVSALSTSKEKASNAFVVEGVAADALREAYEVLAKHRERQEKFPKDAKLSLVFFASESGYYVNVTEVVIEGNVISVHYKFVPHLTRDATVHFAIVPLSTLKPGTYDVKVVQNPSDMSEVPRNYPPIPAQEVERIICKPFSFRIE